MKKIEFLKGFELILWITSVVVVVSSFLIPEEKDYLTLIASLIGVTALIFVAKGYVIGQVLTVIFAVFYGIISYFFKYYGEMITYLLMTAPIAVMAVISWIKHPYHGGKVVEVGLVSKKQAIFMSISAVAVTIGLYFVLLALGNANMLFSTISVTTSFVASYLTFLRSPYYALAYSANDVVLIILWSMAFVENSAYLPMIVCFIVFLVNDLYGFINWSRMKRAQKDSK